MSEKSNRNIKILGAGWLGLGGIFLALAFVALLSVVIGDDPETAAFEAGDAWWIVVLVLLGIGAILTVPGLALLRRNPAARRLIPNPPKDTDGRREESGRGVRELQGK